MKFKDLIKLYFMSIVKGDLSIFKFTVNEIIIYIKKFYIQILFKVALYVDKDIFDQEINNYYED